MPGLANLSAKAAEAKETVASMGDDAMANAVRTLAQFIARKIVSVLKDNLPKSLADLFCEPSEITMDELKASDFRCEPRVSQASLRPDVGRGQADTLEAAEQFLTDADASARLPQRG